MKFFCAETHERLRYDEALSRYIKASVLNQNSLSVLNIGQVLIISLGMMGAMWCVCAACSSATLENDGKLRCCAGCRRSKSSLER